MYVTIQSILEFTDLTAPLPVYQVSIKATLLLMTLLNQVPGNAVGNTAGDKISTEQNRSTRRFLVA